MTLKTQTITETDMPATATATAPRARTRRVNLVADTTAETRTALMKAKLAEIRRQAKVESAARSLKDKLCKELEKEMTSMSLRELSTFLDGKEVVGIIGHGDPKNVIDVHLLAAKVTKEQLLSVVTASQGAVKDAFGSNVATTCLVEKQGDLKLRVEEKK